MSISIENQYNYKAPNFWQSMGLGVLGAFTGGMGMGGFGIGSYGMGCGMDMGGSLFSMLGYGMGGFGMGSYGMYGGYGYGGYGFGGYGMGCGCYGMSNAQLGMSIGSFALNTLFTGISQMSAQRKAAKAAKVQSTTTAENNIETLKNEIKALQDENDKLDVVIDYNTTLPNAVKNACSAESSAFTSACNSYIKIESKNLSEFYDDVPAIKTKQSEIDSLTTETDPDGTKKASLEDEIEKLAQAEKDRQLKKASEARADAKQKLEDAISAKIEANEAEITKKSADLKKETDKLGEVYTGKIDNQERYEQVVGKYNSTNNSFEKDINSKNYDNYLEAFKFKYRQYNNESNETKKEDIKKEAEALYNNILGFKDAVPKDVKSLYDKMMGNTIKHGV